MFLSKVVLNHHSREVCENICNSDYLHKRVMEGFNDYFMDGRSFERKDKNILFRTHFSSSSFIIYVQSEVEPNWYGKEWVLSANIKCIDSILDFIKSGKVLSFDLDCIPYFTDETGKLRSYVKADDKIEWFRKKGDYNGFKLLSCRVSSSNKKVTNIGGHSNIIFNLSNLVGKIEVTDADAFKQFFKKGVGRQKAYGAGMILLG